MYTWIPSKGYARHSVPESVEQVLRALGDVGTLPGLRSSKGGINRPKVVAALRARRERAGLADTEDRFFDGHDRTHRIGLRVEAGRAHQNNDGLLAVLEAAVHPAVDVLVLVVPTVYKGSATAEKVRERIRWVMSSPGAELGLVGVAVTDY